MKKFRKFKKKNAEKIVIIKAFVYIQLLFITIDLFSKILSNVAEFNMTLFYILLYVGPLSIMIGTMHLFKKLMD